MKYNGFLTHHSPWGAYSSFLLGKPGDGGGFVINDVRSPHSDIYIGYKREGENTYVMPFCEVKETDFEEAFGIGKIGNEKWITKVSTIEEAQIQRTLTMSTDELRYNNLSFKLYSPSPRIMDINSVSKEEMKKHCVPAILAEFTYDNRSSETRTKIFFGMNGVGRLIGDHSDLLAGGASQRQRGFACLKSEGVDEYIGMNAIASIVEGTTHKYKLGNNVLIQMEVEPHEIKTISIALGTYQDGYITSGVETRFLYTDYFSGLEDAFEFLLENKDYYKELCENRDKEIREAPISDERKLLIAQACHSYLASTQLMLTRENEYFWNVGEGEYCMMNTLDLVIDHLFYEFKYHPWTIKNTLDFFWNRHSYYDQVKDEDGNVYEGGISFSHDCGVGNMFAAPHSSVYEVDQAVGCFSYMTMEELLNYSISSCLYGIKEADEEDRRIIGERLAECFSSIKNRDRNHDGVMDSDSTKALGYCEITTYDSLDHSLARASDNLYIAVKTWSTFVCMEAYFAGIAKEELAKECKEYALLAAETIVAQYDEKDGYIPSIFYRKDTSKIIPAIEALVYPYQIGLHSAVQETGPYSELIQCLKKHFRNIMKPGICIEEENGGWKLTSGNTNTWMSKIFICQYVAEKILGFDLAAMTPNADKAHADWQFVGCSDMCAVDQVNCETGKPIGSRLYPRLVTSMLWI